MCKIHPPNFLWLKAIIYRVVRIFLVFISGYFVLGNPSVAIEIAAADLIIATLFYYWYDKVWCNIELYLQKLYLKFKYRSLK